MKVVNRLLANICTTDLKQSRDFYTKLFDFDIDYDSDWFVHLMSKDQQLELGLIDQKSDLVPKGFQSQAGGFYLTFVVDDVDELYELAKFENVEIVAAPEDTFYGQRRVLIKDPNGTLLDVSAPIPNFRFD